MIVCHLPCRSLRRAGCAIYPMKIMGGLHRSVQAATTFAHSCGRTAILKPQADGKASLLLVVAWWNPMTSLRSQGRGSMPIHRKTPVPDGGAASVKRPSLYPSPGHRPLSISAYDRPKAPAPQLAVAADEKNLRHVTSFPLQVIGLFLARIAFPHLAGQVHSQVQTRAHEDSSHTNV